MDDVSPSHYLNPDVYGHRLITPFLWCTDQYYTLFSSLPPNAMEMAHRVIFAVAATFLIIEAGVVALVGLAVKSVSPCQITDADKEKLNAIAEKIAQFYNSMFPNFGQNLKNNPGGQLREMIAHYRKVLTPFLKIDPDLGIDTRVTEIEKHINYFDSLRGYVFSWTDPVREGPRMNQYGIMPVLARGNCCYLSCRIGLLLQQARLTELGFWPADSALAEPLDDEALLFRQEIANWLSTHKNDPEVAEQIQYAIADFVDAKRKALLKELEEAQTLLFVAEQDIRSATYFQKQQAESQLKKAQERPGIIEGALKELEAFTVENYLKLVKESGFFASKAEIYAISTKYHIQIKVMRQYGESPPFSLPEDAPFTPAGWKDGDPSITIVHKDGKHFDFLQQP